MSPSWRQFVNWDEAPTHKCRRIVWNTLETSHHQPATTTSSSSLPSITTFQSELCYLSLLEHILAFSPPHCLEKSGIWTPWYGSLASEHHFRIILFCIWHLTLFYKVWEKKCNFKLNKLQLRQHFLSFTPPLHWIPLIPPPLPFWWPAVPGRLETALRCGA